MPGSGQPISRARSKRRANVAEPVEAVVEGALVEEQLGADRGRRGRGAARAAGGRTGRGSRRRLCGGGTAARQGAMASAALSPIRGLGEAAARLRAAAALRGLRRGDRGGRRLLPDCWATDRMAGQCRLRALRPAAGGDRGRHCARCLADPPQLDRMRAAVAYDELPRSIALRLKYGRKVALARTMARYMAPLRGRLGDGALLVPVPLHRRRLWWRGFNQSGLVARRTWRAAGACRSTSICCAGSGGRRRSRA